MDLKITSDVELVLLDVSVKDSKGGFVSGLQKDNFKIFDDKALQDITIFQSQDVPVTVGLVVDNSGSVRPKKGDIITAALTFVRKSNPQDEMFVVNFNDEVRLGLPKGVDFTDQHQMLRDALLLNPAEGRTALYDGLKTALGHLDKGRLDKKTLILIADGGDNMSDTTRKEILALIEESLATIYTVGIYNADDKDKDPGFLRRIAEISGGEYYHPQDITHLVPVCESIAKDIRNRYTIGYSPKNVKFDGTIRKLRVLAANADGKKLEVRTRNQYVAASREESASRGDRDMNKAFYGRSSGSRRRRRLQIAEFLLIIAGLTGVSWFAYSYVDAHVYQSYESYRLDEQRKGQDPTLTGYLRSLIDREGAVAPAEQPPDEPEKRADEQPPKRATLEIGKVIGRLELPRLKISTIVREGSDDKTLKRAAGHVPYTSLPGEHGNVGIAAHRDTFFRNLRGVREGDIIQFKTTWGDYEYIVDSLKVVKPQNVEVLESTPSPSITLVTCYPFNYVGSAPHRYIVRARQVSPTLKSSKTKV